MMLPALILAVLAQAAPAASGAQADIDAGLQSFKRHRFMEAQASFEKAVQEDPTSAAATFYLAYTYYKIAEPKRPFHPDKQKAADMFAKAFSLDPNFRPVWGSGPPKK